MAQFIWHFSQHIRIRQIIKIKYGDAFTGTELSNPGETFSDVFYSSDFCLSLKSVMLCISVVVCNKMAASGHYTAAGCNGKHVAQSPSICASGT